MDAYNKVAALIVFFLTLFIISGCTTNQNAPQTPTTNTQIANPASVYCVNQGYNNTIETQPDGSQLGYCNFPDGKRCEEWAYYRGNCTDTS